MKLIYNSLGFTFLTSGQFLDINMTPLRWPLNIATQQWKIPQRPACLADVLTEEAPTTHIWLYLRILKHLSKAHLMNVEAHIKSLDKKAKKKKKVRYFVETRFLSGRRNWTRLYLKRYLRLSTSLFSRSNVMWYSSTLCRLSRRKEPHLHNADMTRG